MPRVFRATSFLALLFCAVAAASCGDPFAITAPFQTVKDSFAISALTRTSGSARALWRVGGFQRFRLDSIGGQFDLGLDVDANGRILVYPARTITVPPPGTLAAPPIVALQASSTPYETADRAPEAGYITDTAVVVTRGQTVFVRTNSDVCLSQTTGGTLLYAKFQVVSFDPATREFLIRSTIQPSCNFRSFATGVPTF